MSEDFIELKSLGSLEFVPLSKVKARLSEMIRKITTNPKRLAITTSGRPSAVILSYEDFLYLLEMLPAPISQSRREKIINFEKWKGARKKREVLRNSILNLFDVKSLSRKGQKKYKKESVYEFTE